MTNHCPCRWFDSSCTRDVFLCTCCRSLALCVLFLEYPVRHWSSRGQQYGAISKKSPFPFALSMHQKRNRQNFTEQQLMCVSQNQKTNITCGFTVTLFPWTLKICLLTCSQRSLRYFTGHKTLLNLLLKYKKMLCVHTWLSPIDKTNDRCSKTGSRNKGTQRCMVRFYKKRVQKVGRYKTE